jgi:hypothetical protein
LTKKSIFKPRFLAFYSVKVEGVILGGVLFQNDLKKTLPIEAGDSLFTGGMKCVVS